MTAGGIPSANRTFPARSAWMSWSGRFDRPQRGQQPSHLPGYPPGGRAQQRTRVPLAPRHLIADRPRVLHGAPPGRARNAGQRSVQRPAHGDQPGPARRDARPVRGRAGDPARGRPPLRHPVPGHRPDRPRHPETRTSQPVVDLGEPSPGPRRIGGLEHHLPGPPGGSLSARQPHRYDTGQPERDEHRLRHRIRAFRSDHAGDDNHARQPSQPICRARPRSRTRPRPRGRRATKETLAQPTNSSAA